MLFSTVRAVTVAAIRQLDVALVGEVASLPVRAAGGGLGVAAVLPRRRIMRPAKLLIPARLSGVLLLGVAVHTGCRI